MEMNVNLYLNLPYRIIQQNTVKKTAQFLLSSCIYSFCFDVILHFDILYAYIGSLTNTILFYNVVTPP